ncbi:hypothetical protein [Paenibacillus humicola]|uniref:hypothetical protein n=1 Tax=Paenibacillus humicola TaxID=3110540 RepID=UPI00237B7D16|nr:hypothetical protein [Paenibacillus humicola]
MTAAVDAECRVRESDSTPKIGLYRPNGVLFYSYSRQAAASGTDAVSRIASE